MTPSSSIKVLQVVVVGGGISGLAAAHRILEESQRLQKPVQLQLLEADSRLGGVIHTVERDGFVLEGGPDSFISEKPWALALCRRLGLESRLIGTGESHRRSFIVRQGRLLPVPDGFYLMAPTQLWPVVTTSIFSWPGKLRMAADLFLPRRKTRAPSQDESLASFVRRRLGQEALERMAQPMVGGIYTADPEVLSLRATMPRFLEMEEKHRSLILAMLRQRQQALSTQGTSAGPRYGLFVSLDRGMRGFVEALQNKLPAGALHLNCEVRSLQRNVSARRWVLQLKDGARIEADAVCLALAAYQSAALLEDLDSKLAGSLREIQYASTATVNLAYREEDVPRPLEGFGFVVPAIEKREMLACTFSHMKFAGRAPQGHILLRAFMGGALQPQSFEYGDEEMLNVVGRNLAELLDIRRQPVFSLVERHPSAMAQYHVGHLDLVARIEALIEKHPSLQLAGNAFTGIGIPDCVRRGEECASRILNDLVSLPVSSAPLQVSPTTQG